MKNKRTDLRTNQSGSALPFVIIIGLVLLVLVASLATVATGGITFSQKSVENRQAYLDAKSVIQYGQILIDKKLAEMKAANPSLANQTAANTIGEPIFYIKGVRSNSLDPLTLSEGVVGDPSIIGVVKLSWGQTAFTGDAANGTAKTAYTLSVETQNLTRKLDYKTGFDYLLTKTSTPQVPVSNDSTTMYVSIVTNGTLFDFIKTHGMNYGISSSKPTADTLLISPNSLSSFDKSFLNIGDGPDTFNFLSYKTLIIRTDRLVVSKPMPNVASPTYQFGIRDYQFGTGTNGIKTTSLLYFAQAYTPDFGIATPKSTNILKAKDIVIIGDLTLGTGSKLQIECDNLWITGKLYLATGTTDNWIKATKSVIIEGGKEFVGTTQCPITAPSIWLQKALTTTPGATGGTTSTTTTLTVVPGQTGYY